MGAAASTEQRETVLKLLVDKPGDASDVTDLNQAKAEIRNLRKVARQYQDALSGGGKDSKKRREVVMDRGEEVKQSSASYVPKVIQKPDAVKATLMRVVTSNVLFSSYAKEEKEAIVDAFEQRLYPARTSVIQQGESGDRFYMVEYGELEIYVKPKSDRSDSLGNKLEGKVLQTGDSFGELALMYGTPRQATIKTCKDCALWEIDRKTFRGIITYYKYVRNKQYIDFLKHVEFGTKKLGEVMDDAELEKLVISLERETFDASSLIIREGNKGDEFYIIIKGEVQVLKGDKEVAVLKEGNFFGEKALLTEDTRQASCIAKTSVTCLTLGREDFVEMFGSHEYLVKKAEQTAQTQQDKGEKASEKPGDKIFEFEVTIDELEIKGMLGCGAFGRVKLAYYAQKDEYYALKCQSKRSIVESQLTDHVLNEMRIMRKINHPYIAKLYSALQDRKYIYFVLELLQGGELFTYLRNKNKLDEASTRFYAATVVYAFSTLHAKKIAYRDLKPENLVMDTKGYVKLVDFGLAKQLLQGKTWTLCGTPDYLAPEIILNEGHDLAVDYWALGVLIYEVVFGSPPFYADDPMEVYEKILSGNPPYPNTFSKNLTDLVRKLLRSQQGKRLGNTRGGTAAVVKHKWFTAFDWAALEEGNIQPAYKPVVSSKSDISLFDHFEDLEETTESDWMPDLMS